MSGSTGDEINQEVLSEKQEHTDKKSGPFGEDLLWNALRGCYDPEIPLNIVDLGLVYDLRVEGDEENAKSSSR